MVARPRRASVISQAQVCLFFPSAPSLVRSRKWLPVLPFILFVLRGSSPQALLFGTEDTFFFLRIPRLSYFLIPKRAGKIPPGFYLYCPNLVACAFPLLTCTDRTSVFCDRPPVFPLQPMRINFPVIFIRLSGRDPSRTLGTPATSSSFLFAVRETFFLPDAGLAVGYLFPPCRINRVFLFGLSLSVSLALRSGFPPPLR